MLSIEDRRTISRIILNQIGHGALFMLGAKDHILEDNGTSFRVRGSKIANHVKVTLQPNDTYTVEFRKIHGYKCTLIKSFSDIYCDQITAIIGRTLGLATSL